MEVLEDADVVVGESQVVPGLGEERVAPPGVLEVVDQGAEQQGRHLHIFKMLPKVAHLRATNGLLVVVTCQVQGEMQRCRKQWKIHSSSYVRIHAEPGSGDSIRS